MDRPNFAPRRASQSTLGHGGQSSSVQNPVIIIVTGEPEERYLSLIRRCRRSRPPGHPLVILFPLLSPSLCRALYGTRRPGYYLFPHVGSPRRAAAAKTPPCQPEAIHPCPAPPGAGSTGDRCSRGKVTAPSQDAREKKFEGAGQPVWNPPRFMCPVGRIGPIHEPNGETRKLRAERKGARKRPRRN
ncbi:hypothetical protein BO78DRAFT_154009 [Aspergillus sclerotiicarbonarius CBS 121057]|uniref:Uncharacterized protein n=1 Tax=Aspergillus sclerotiicarbonarius (strain CBS 121057 / IBT 28362) TaxID=1448318 RepID=A0A319EUB5_ASPSB|nr:hypothetical protein BO78DRAFT_154009 [Aspergillus sclerotiicarbonarius CBS 121057]